MPTPVGTPGTTANGTTVCGRPRALPCTASSSANGSPATRRTTYRPLRASAEHAWPSRPASPRRSRTSPAASATIEPGRPWRRRRRASASRSASRASAGQQAGIAGAGPDERDRAQHLRERVMSSSPSGRANVAAPIVDLRRRRAGRRQAAVRRPSASSGRARWPTAGRRHCRRLRSPSHEGTLRCRSSPSAISAKAPTGAEQPASSAASSARSAATADTGVGMVETGEQRPAPRRRTCGTRPPARPGRVPAAPGSGRAPRSPRQPRPSRRSPA